MSLLLLHSFSSCAVLDVRMGQTLLGVLGLFSLSALLCCGHAQDAVLTIEPNCSTLFTGESVSFICDMKEGGETEWFYSFEKKGYQFVNYNTNKIIKLQLLTEDSGDYQCVSQHKHSGVIKRSNTVSLTVSDDDVILEHPALTVFRGESVPLRCRRRTQTDGRRASFYRDASPIDMDTNHPSQIISENTAEATVRVAADGSSYMCKFDEHKQSKPTKLKVEPHRPKATLRRDTGSGPNVTLTCSVTGTSSGWKYYWYRGKKTSEPLTKEEGLLLSDDTIRVSQEGIYWCRGGRGEPVYYTQYSNTLVTLRPVVTLQPKWPKIYKGERISLTCQIEDGGDAEWEYVWRKGTSPLTERTNVYKISYTSTFVNGDYRCMGVMKGDWSPTEWSDVFTLTVSEKTHPGLQVTPSWLSPGASVTLTCSLEHPSAGWRFFWYKAVPKLPNSYYSYEMLPGSINGTTQDSYIVSGQTHTAGYVCRAGRGDPVQHTYHSGSKFVWCRDFHSALFLTVSPDRVQHFDSDSVSLSCEGNSTEWRVMTFDGSGYPSLCRTSPTATGPICKQNLWLSAAVYWCESGSGQFSSPVNISVHNDGIILESPVQPVVEGTSVTLGCRLKTENVPSNVLFYKNNKLVQHDTRRELTIAAVSKSHEGLYKCERTDSKLVWTSAESWMSVKSVSSESSAFPLPLTVGLVGGLSFIVLLLLLLLFCIRKSKGSCFIRSQRTNQSSATDHVINQDEAPGDACVYELIKGPEVNENDESRDVIYSSVELKTLVENGKSTPAVADETVYSEVKTRKTPKKKLSQTRPVQFSCEMSLLLLHSFSSCAVLDVRMGQTLLGVLGLFSLSALLCCGHAQDAVLTIEPNCSTLFTGESVSFICDMKEGGETDWFYSFKKKGYQFVNYYTNKIIKLQLLTEDSGDYQCVGQHKLNLNIIKRSNTVSLTVSDDDVILEHPALTVFRGESVPLRCRRRTQTDGRRASFYRDASPIDMDTNHPSQIISENTAEATVRVAADGSSYMCKFDEHEQSKPTKLKVEPHRPKATLRRDTGSGPNVTLTCSVTGTSSGWKYYWYRGKKTSEPLTKEEGLLLSDDTIRVSQEGIYWCRGGRGEPVYYTQYSNPIVTLRPVVTLQPKWPKIYRGERISLTCQIEDGGDAEWEYVWTKGTSPLTERTNVYKISYASTSVNGDYRCMGVMKGDRSSTEWSDVFTLTVSEKTHPGLQVTPSWLSPGASVTLTCSLEHPSAGWRFFWYKAVPKLSDNYYSYEMLPGSINGTTQDSYIVSGQTHTAGYVCRAGRGDPVQHTYHSGSKFVWCRDFHSALFLTVSPDRVQHFDSDSVSLSCEGNSTEWRVMTFDGSGYPSLCRTSPTATGPICKQNLWLSAAVYWCESGSGQFSSAVNITVHNDGIILESPVQPVVEGTSVTLGCRLKTENVPSNVLFYKNNKLVQHDTRRELTIAAVSKSHEGLYKCERTDSKQVWTSAESWMSVKSVSSESSAFPLPLTVGLVGGLSFIFLLLLLLLFCIRKSKGSCFIRSQRTNQSSATDHVINQDEAPDSCRERLAQVHRENRGSATDPTLNNYENQQQLYSSLLHGDACVYETIRGSGNTGEEIVVDKNKENRSIKSCASSTKQGET
ncbi:uncharacterized protein LOC118289046 [Scophthalmus maximus]|uniref:uncharacterized protein LOC118289046 n=1 Tax=Scophthalmus maximus TaxID=52904 RepID=UPI001FA92337|nr:uncharacterized protein LOC118289046 [Scophthalmus maximus]